MTLPPAPSGELLPEAVSRQIENEAERWLSADTWTVDGLEAAMQRIAEAAAQQARARQSRGSVFREAGPVTIGCMAPESRDAMDLALERYRTHAEQMKQNQGHVPDDPVYSFAYWLFRWSGIITAVDVNAPENPWVTFRTPPPEEER